MRTAMAGAFAEGFCPISPRLLICIISCVIALFVPGRVRSQNNPDKYKTIHVKLKEEFLPRRGFSSGSGRTGLSKMDRVGQKYSVFSIERIFPEAGIHEEAHRAYGLHLWYEIRFTKTTQLKDAIAEYRKLDYFQKVEECKEYRNGIFSESDLPVLLSGTSDPGQNEIQIDGSQLPAGVYACRLMFDRGPRIIRLVKY